MRFYGNEICCGSYACMNAICNEEIDLQLFEISTSTPFGLKHFENEYFDRIITTYYDPNKGMDAALGLWGYESLKFSAFSGEEAVQIIKQHIRNDRIVLGPIDMGALGYYELNQLLKRMDHYLTLQYISEDSVLCVDSEGFAGYPLHYKELETYISYKNVPEAENKISIRVIKKRQEWDIEEILSTSYRYACRNLCDAEMENEGSKIMGKVYNFLSQYSVHQWKLPFLYDIQYLIQRKCLANVLNETYKNQFSSGGVGTNDVNEILQQQLKILGEMYNELRLHEKIILKQFEVFGEQERNLLYCMQRVLGEDN